MVTINRLLWVTFALFSGCDAVSETDADGSFEEDTVITYELVVIAGEDNAPNIFDPSVEYPTGEGSGWLAYTDVEGDARPIGPLHHTNIAQSDDGGRTWTFVTRANASTLGTLTDETGRRRTGAWAYEVPSIVHVPDDRNAPWKLFTHRYFWTEEERLAAYGWIALKTAKDPGGPWSEERALFGTNFTPFDPYETDINIADLHGSMRNIVALSEPGTLYHDGVLYLSLTALRPSGPDRIILLASDDFGQTWRFIGNLITRQDAARLGATRFDGSSLVRTDGEIYLLASPERNGLLHDGTSIFRFQNIRTGTLERVDNRLLVYNHIPVQTDHVRSDNRGGGQADYDERNIAGGVLFPQIDSDNMPGPIAQIYQTGRGLDN